MTAGTASPTLDALFSRSVSRQPDTLALIDPIDKARVCGLPPRRLSYAQADRTISALSKHFADVGLSPGAIVAALLPNTVEFALTVLAAHRAGLVVALLPQLWRQADLTAALNRIAAQAIVTMGQIDGVRHADLAMNAAAEAFSIRHVCSFGDNLPDGMVALDPIVNDRDRVAVHEPADARQPALITFDVTSEGMHVVPRSHLQIVAGGLALFLESGIPQGSRIATTVMPGSIAGLTCSLVMSVVSGSTLSMHHPFDAAALARQLDEDGINVLVAPHALLTMMTDGGALARQSTLHHALGLWRSPELVSQSPDWTHGRISLTDVYLFGEAGVIGARRATPAPLPLTMGPYRTPRNNPRGSLAGELLLTTAGTLALRGPAIPAAAYAMSGNPDLPLDCVDTGYAARVTSGSATLEIGASTAGFHSIGGYRFRSKDLQDWSRRLGQGAVLTALPDDVSGHHLAGRAQDNARAREALNELGLNPLMADAFRERPAPS